MGLPTIFIYLYFIWTPFLLSNGVVCLLDLFPASCQLQGLPELQGEITYIYITETQPCIKEESYKSSVKNMRSKKL